MDLYRSKHSDKKYSNRNSSSNDRPSRSFRNSRDNVRQDTTVTCADCGDQCTVPFVPRSNKPVYCSDCFRENKPDDFGRGSGAASWGKYISAPDVAREELRVLCLNCSAIAEPISKPENERPRSKPKRSKYFPR